MRPRSLSFRLALVAAAGSALALLAAGVVFISLFRQAVERNFDERLDVLLSALVGAAAADDTIRPEISQTLGEPNFSLPQSGWYWQIRDGATGEIVAASPSLFGDTLPPFTLPTAQNTPRVLEFIGPDGRRLRARERLITLPGGQSYGFLVAGDADAVVQDVARFRTVVALTLGAFAFLLAIGMGLLIRFGLRPLRDVRRSLRRVRHGDAAQLEGDFPLEIAPLVDDLNALLNSNREIIERARTHVGNLAHALKTPIAVLQNEARDVRHPLADKVAQQVAVMRDQVDHHLNRARMAAQANVIGAVTPVRPVAEALARVMRKVHQERQLAIAVEVAAELRFRGERQDLEEMVGNLFDNACKWAAGRVRLRTATLADPRRPSFVLSVEDDGPGLAEARKAAALARGTRIDHSKPGSGLGLSIVVELARIYGGALALETSDWGGLAARLTLPMAPEADL